MVRSPIKLKAVFNLIGDFTFYFKSRDSVVNRAPKYKSGGPG
ncbi:hypothetical protein Nizo1839_0700 [Lactiplantibacillus plantarum]|nr:hypothetical protein SF2A35B_1084 [Lactiplantibacillus plantarum]KZT82694.1 hypothetical protein Nizo1839_0700 [Lactiplantibacillus plantarum]